MVVTLPSQFNLREQIATTRSKHPRWLTPSQPCRETEDARRRPYCVLGDRRYDAEAIRRGLRARHGVPFLARDSGGITKASGMVKSLVCQPYIHLTREPVRLGQEASQ
jgi:hypothetical protein